MILPTAAAPPLPRAHAVPPVPRPETAGVVAT